jgi:HPr kinase/phosphorylase
VSVQHTSTPSLTVQRLLQSRAEAIGLPLELLSGRGGLNRQISSPHIQKTGLALAGFHEYLRPARVLVFGESEMSYLEGLDHDARVTMLSAMFAHEIPCVLITGGGQAPPDLLSASDTHRVPVLRTTVATPIAIAKIGSLLDDALAVREVMHGVLMDILGLGVLIVGESGIGKSECALDLIVRGHRLVADDTVEVRRRGETGVLGTCPELTRHHMEVRGLGVINIRDLFGVASTRASKRIELVVQLERWDPEREYDRLGLEENVFELFDVKIPLIRMPVAPGRNLAILVEVAARNQLLKSRGLNAARDLATRLEQQLRAAEADAAAAEAGADDDTEPGEDA